MTIGCDAYVEMEGDYFRPACDGCRWVGENFSSPHRAQAEADQHNAESDSPRTGAESDAQKRGLGADEAVGAAGLESSQ